MALNTSGKVGVSIAVVVVVLVVVVSTSVMLSKSAKTPATVQGPTASKTFGSVQDPTLQAVNMSGFTPEDLKLLTFTVSRTPGEDVGTYPTTVTVSGTPRTNYDIKVTSGTFTIHPKPVLLTAPTASKVYGSDKSEYVRIISQDPMGVHGDRCLYVKSTPVTSLSPPLGLDYWVTAPLAANIVGWDTGALWLVDIAAQTAQSVSTQRYLTVENQQLKAVSTLTPCPQLFNGSTISCYPVEGRVDPAVCNIYAGDVQPDVSYLRGFKIAYSW